MSVLCVSTVLTATTRAFQPLLEAQVQSSDASVEDEVVRLLRGEEFLDGRNALIAKGSPILPVLLKLFLNSVSDEQVVRIMSILRDIAGNKEAFLPKISALARGANPEVQIGALLALTQIGTTEHAKVFEEIVANTQQRTSTRVLAARALEKLGTQTSLKVIATLLPVERTKMANRLLVTALETAQEALQKRFQR
jgi:HEAT repeat protein